MGLPRFHEGRSPSSQECVEKDKWKMAELLLTPQASILFCQPHHHLLLRSDSVTASDEDTYWP